MVIEFFIPLAVKPKQSFRAANGHGYTPKPIKVNADALAYHAGLHRPDQPIDEPVSVEYVFQIPYLKKDGKRAKAGETIPHDTKPDLENLAKQLNDVLENVGIISNDSRIWKATFRKVRTLNCGVQVRITTEGETP